ncbi:uncharacterized protein LOC129597449, partial [Paramacrobiotus metropolitanus]|uniref:uncharacterized protein LOC129597449 n=1 Tax=Paramacrobiotus metropolitanus TaxID=2943436 RepID=UPI00244609C5
MPTHLHTDQGSHFTAKTFAKVARIFGIEHTFGTAYHPEGQGQVERSMQTILDGNRKECDAKDGHRWHRNLQYVVCGINRAKHATTGFSPYYMLYGREMTIPQDVITGTNAPEHYTDKEQYIRRMKERLQRAHDIAKTNIDEAFQKAAELYNKKKSVPDFQKRDLLVLVEYPTRILPGRN